MNHVECKRVAGCSCIILHFAAVPFRRFDMPSVCETERCWGGLPPPIHSWLFELFDLAVLWNGLSRVHNHFCKCSGLVLFFSYATTHYIYSIQRNLVIRDFLICIVLIGLMNIYILTGIRREILQYHIGNLASFITVLFFAAPLTNMVTVIKTGNVSSLPLPFISMTLVATFLWFLYGLVVDDIYVQLPNAIGLVLGVAQLSVYFLYRSRNPIKMSRLKVPLNEYEL
ncbi:unnamed protein product [Bemisia tabaci]|uniref:Sugar transporter SWEET n=1 Tax=Bemisia tabaci TaxID=7038 RepID=A0A9P0EZP9_BEMTA|nr:unnamed protein product [Bemisia tabaci]